MIRHAKRQDIPTIDFVQEGLIVAFWRTGKMDTLDIAERLNLREFQVHNLLLHLREGGR